MKILTFNINGIRAYQTKLELSKDINFNDYDIVCFQEIKIQEKDLDKINIKFDGYKYWNCGNIKGSHGVSIYTKIKPISIDMEFGNEELDNEGRLINLQFDEFYLITCYTPNSRKNLERIEFRRKWDKYFRIYCELLMEKKPIIVCGDFNVVHKDIDIWSQDLDKRNKKLEAGCSIYERQWFDKLLAIGLKDSFRELYPDERAYSWFSTFGNSRENFKGWRLDYHLISSNIMQKVKEVKILYNVYGSDHLPVLLEIEF